MPRTYSVALAALVTLSSAYAEAQERPERKRECARTSEDGQQLRTDRRLRAARQRFLACAQEHCPDVVRRDCLVWIAEVEAALPTVVFVVHDAHGEDVATARLLVDGQPEATGTAVALDPGVHAVRAELPDGSVAVKEIQASEAVKNRVVVLDARDSPRRGDARKPDSDEPRASAPTAGYVLLGASALLFGVTAYLGIDGLSRAHTLRDTCKPTCDPDDVERVRTQFRVSYVAGALAGVALGAGLYLVLFRSPRSGADVRVNAGAARADLVVRF